MKKEFPKSPFTLRPEPGLKFLKKGVDMRHSDWENIQLISWRFMGPYVRNNKRETTLRSLEEDCLWSPSSQGKSLRGAQVSPFARFHYQPGWESRSRA